jgi:AP-4 complex subunit epsilon-1
LGQADAQASSGMYEILLDTMKKADVGINAGYAIVYECVKCITKIYPNTKLLDAAADAIARFMDSRSHNLKYLGVTGLAMIVETHPQYATQHQMAVMDCLEDPDETLQRKTLDLLYRMTNPVNVEFITDKLLLFLSGTTDLFLKQQLTTRICSVAERYAPNNAWYIKSITQLFEVSGDMVSGEVAQNLMSLIAEGTGESEQEDMLLRQTAIELYVQLLQEKPPAKLPRILLETMAWVLGEYAYLSTVCSLEDILTRLCQWNKTGVLASSTRKFLTSAIFKLVAQAGTCPPQAAAVIDEYTRSKDPDLQQRCLEFQGLLTTAPQYLGDILPMDASAEDVDVDVNLSFLDGYCQEALANGARPYSKPEDDDDDDEDYNLSSASNAPAFKMTPYAKPDTNVSRSHMIRGMGSGGVSSSGSVVTPPPGGNLGNASVTSTATTTAAGGDDGLTLNTRGAANVWGKKTAAPEPSAAPAPPLAPSNPYGGFGASTSTSSGYSGNNAYGSSSGYGAPAPAPPAQKTREQLEKERQAAALFGGIVPGSMPPPAPAPPPPRPAPAVAPPVAAPPVVAPPVTAPPPAPEIDLLDMGAFDATPTPVPAAAIATDIFGSTTLAPTPVVAAPPPIVETASSDEADMGVPSPAASDAERSTTASAAIEPIDPFAAEGLLDNLQDKPMTSFELSSSIYEYNGSAMAPLKITTAQFGQQWGSCSATSPASIASSKKISSLAAFMRECEAVGLYPVESIVATNEGICAGMVESGSLLVLIHGKVSLQAGGTARLDITVKSTDATLSGSLALYLQNMMN